MANAAVHLQSLVFETGHVHLEKSREEDFRLSLLRRLEFAQRACADRCSQNWLLKARVRLRKSPRQKKPPCFVMIGATYTKLM